jgi:small conductance mechanosensitive channel
MLHRQISHQIACLKTLGSSKTVTRIYFPNSCFSYRPPRSFSSTSNDEKPPKRSFISIENQVLRLIKATKLIEDEDLSQLIARSVNLGWYSVLGMTMLGTMGFDTKPLIASLGVAGFAVGFALKDAATHLTSGIMLVLQKPFKKGDYLKLLLLVPHEGIVESIDVRYVHLRTKDDNVLLIPCSVVYANSIVVGKPPADWPSTLAVTSVTLPSPTPSAQK